MMGKGDKTIVGELPTAIPSGNILFVGLDWEREQIKERQKE